MELPQRDPLHYDRVTHASEASGLRNTQASRRGPFSSDKQGDSKRECSWGEKAHLPLHSSPQSRAVPRRTVSCLGRPRELEPRMRRRVMSGTETEASWCVEACWRADSPQFAWNLKDSKPSRSQRTDGRTVKSLMLDVTVGLSKSISKFYLVQGPY